MIRIDWVSSAILIAAIILSQIRTVPLKVRYLVLAAACALIAVMRLRAGAQGTNMVFVVIAGVLAVFYAVRAMRVPPGR